MSHRPDDEKMGAGVPTPGSAARANREFYATRAAGYDDSTLCIAGRERARLSECLEAALALNPGTSRALDAGGGTGNAAELLLARGIDPVVVDVSPEMAGRWERKRATLGGSAPVFVDEIGRFLRARPGEWDLIVFSSVLHHLDDPQEVVRLAARGLAAGGVFVSIFDPTPATPLVRRLRRIDWIAYAVAHDRELLRTSLRRRLDRNDAGARPGDEHVGRLAERHALSGLDDRALAAILDEEGVAVVRHDRIRGARTGIVRAALRARGEATEFSLIARRAS